MVPVLRVHICGLNILRSLRIAYIHVLLDYFRPKPSIKNLKSFFDQVSLDAKSVLIFEKHNLVSRLLSWIVVRLANQLDYALNANTP